MSSIFFIMYTIDSPKRYFSHNLTIFCRTAVVTRRVYTVYTDQIFCFHQVCRAYEGWGGGGGDRTADRRKWRLNRHFTINMESLARIQERVNFSKVD